MKAGALLNADLSTVAVWLRAGFAWWIGELASLVPPRWRRILKPASPLVAVLAPGGGLRFQRDGEPVQVPAPKAGNSVRAVLQVPSSLVLARTLDVPLLSAADTAALLRLDIDRLTPFAADAVVVDWRRHEVDLERNRQRITLGAIRRADLEQQLAAARAAGADPIQAGPAGEDEPLAFDFLPALTGRASVGTRARLWWTIAFILLMANLLAFVLRDMADTRRLQTLVDDQGDAVTLSLKLRQRVEDEVARRRAVADRRAATEPLAAIDAASRALPSGAWVQRLAMSEGAMRLAGYRNDDVDVLAALRSVPRFARVRPSTGDVPARVPAGQPFDVTVDLVAGDGQ